MYETPTLEELVEAVSLYIERTAMPNLTGRAAFHGRVAVNVLGIIARELRDGAAAETAEAARLRALLHADGDISALRTALSEAIRAGEMTAQTPGLVDALLETAADRVAIEQPQYASLQRARETLV
ncbi:MAG: hypothetical protein GC189_00470 [Alphaproteobacteria bacterium]|nr:hypothetical protein [Alphaproteobacteria bacterium]